MLEFVLCCAATKTWYGPCSRGLVINILKLLYSDFNTKGQEHNFEVKPSDLRLGIYMRKISGVWFLYSLAEYPLQVRKFPDHICDLIHDIWDGIQILHSVKSIIDGGRITEGGTQPLFEQPLTFNTVNIQAYLNC